MADKLVAVRIKQQDNTYSNEIPIGAWAENVAYDNTKNLLQVLGTIDMYKGDVQTQLNALFENFNGIAKDIAGAIDDWVKDNMPSWNPEDHLDFSLASSTQAAAGSAVPKLIAINETSVQGTKMQISTTGQQDLTVLTPNDIDDTLSQQGEAADAKATGEMIMINNAATAGTKIRLTTTNEDVSLVTTSGQPFIMRKINAQVKDPTTGNMIPVGILSSDSITQIAAAENAAITRINSKKTEAINQITQMEETIPEDYADFAAEAAYKDMIAQTQVVMTATKTYPAGEYICVNQKLYKTTTAITSGLALVVGTNVEEVKLAESVSASAAQIATNTNDISDLKTQKVNKAGMGEVTSKNIEGMSEIGTPTPDWSNNIFSEAELVATGKYIAGIGGLTGKGYLSDNAGLDTYIIAVEQNTLYSFTNCRTALVVADLEYTPVGDYMAGPNITEINSSTGAYILFSFNPTKYPVNEYEIKKQIQKYQYQIPDNWYIPEIGDMEELDYDNLVDAINDIKQKENRPVYKETKGAAFATNTYISLPVFSCTRKNTRLIFRANIASLGNFEIGFTTKADGTGKKYNRFVIWQNGLTAYLSYNYSQQTMNSEAITHNLNITSGSLQVIIEEHPNATCTITIENNGNTFKHTFEGYIKNNTLQPYCYSAYGSFSNYKFVWSCTDLDKKIWIFGDSYMAYSTARWPYYLEEYGYAKNALFNSFPGCWSSTAITALNSLINYGNPKYAIWALGMNDGSDSESAPSNSWVSGRDSFISVCEENDIEPVFCTIPTVPTINHEQKNAWIRASGYKYIDFARAVNASASGVWNTGTLSSDGIHPTVNGARALFAEFLLDFPEIMQGLDGVYPPIIPEKIGDNTEKKLVFNTDTDSTVTWTNW